MQSCLYDKRPVTRVDYSKKLCPVWLHDGTDSGEIRYPEQIAIDDTTQNIFVADYSANRIQVFNGEGNHLYEISTTPYLIGIALTDEYIFVSTGNKLLKIEKPSNKYIKSAKTEENIWGIETDTNSDIYVVSVSSSRLLCLTKISN